MLIKLDVLRSTVSGLLKGLNSVRDDLSYMPCYLEQKISWTEYPRHQPAAVSLSLSLLGNF